MKDEFDILLGERLRSRRQKLGWSIEQLAAHSDIDLGTISRSENGLVQITLESAIRLCRSLSMTLTELVDQASGSSNEAQLEGQPTPVTDDQIITHEDVLTLVNLYRADRAACGALLSGWLNTIAVQDSDKEAAPFGLQERNLQLLLPKHDAFRFKVRYPTEYRVWVVESIYWLGGLLSRGDIKLLLLAMTENPNRYQPLGRLSKEIIWRLQTGKGERTRLSEVVKLSRELHLDLIGMYDSVEGLVAETNKSHSEYSPNSTEEARLISLFVSVCSWLRKLADDDPSWLVKVRQEMNAAQALLQT